MDLNQEKNQMIQNIEYWGVQIIQLEQHKIISIFLINVVMENQKIRQMRWQL
jgi:hypothetical protein